MKELHGECSNGGGWWWWQKGVNRVGYGKVCCYKWSSTLRRKRRRREERSNGTQC